MKYFILILIIILIIFFIIENKIDNFKINNTNNLNSNLILIHLGNSFPFYIFDCIHQFRIFNNDSNLYSPTSLHSSLKESFEKILQYYYLNNKINFTTLKLFHTYGPNDNRGKVITKIARSIINNEKLSLSPGDQEMDLVHCDDVANAYIELCNLILNNQFIEKCYGITSQKIITLKNLALIIENILNKKGNFAWGEKNYKYREEMVCWRNGLILLPNWKSEIELFDGLQFLKNEFYNV